MRDDARHSERSAKRGVEESARAPLRVLIADDEGPARMRLEDLVRREPGVKIVGMVDNGNAAVEAIRTLSPDLVFLDVQMPGRTGLEVVHEIGAEHMPATIFVTAFDQHAIEAFRVAAFDYLVKPFDDERFEEAFRRARRRLALEHPEPAVKAEYLERIAVEVKGKVRPVPVGEIDYITSDGPYAELHVGDRRHIIREAMQVLEERLDPEKFMRVHRSVIVRLDQVAMLHRAAGGDYEVQMKNGVRLRVSRARREALESWLGVSR